MTTSRPTLAIRLRTTALAAVLAATSSIVTAAPGSRPAADTGSSPFEGIVRIADDLFAPKAALAAFCASNASFTGRLTASSASTTAVSRITDPDVYAYISDVDTAWSCTAYLRYSGVGWNTTTAAGRFDWGNLINSTSVACNYAVGTTDFIKANSTADCPDTDAEYALMATLSAERVYQNDLNHDTIGDYSFIHSDCGTYYSGTVPGEPIRGTEAAPESFAGSNVGNRPGNNCDALTLDGTGTSQTITYDKTAPVLNFDTPDEAAALATVTSAAYTVQFDANDNVAKFGGADVWTLSRKIAAWDGAACGTWTDDTAAGAVTTGSTSASDQTIAQTLASGSCYRWTLGARDANGNTATTITSGPVRRDATALLGVEDYQRFESSDLGAGDNLSVNVTTGGVLLRHPVVSLPIRGSSVSIDLAYNSGDTANVGMGAGWRLNMHRRLTLNADGTVTFIDGDGSRHTFTAPVINGTVTTYTRPATLYATLVKDTSISANEFVLTYRNQARDKFDIAGSEGLLVREEDRFGNGVTLAYVAGTSRISTITDTAASRTITIAYDASNRVSSVTDWAYVDAAGVVQATASGSLRKSCFFYDASSRLAGWTDPLYAPTSACPGSLPATSHATRLAYAAGTAALVSAITKTQTVESAGASAMTTTSRTITTEIAYRGGEVATVTDAEQQSKGSPARITFSRPATDQTLVRRYIVDGTSTALSETKYGLVSVSDALARVQSVWRKLGSTSPVWIEERTVWADDPQLPATERYATEAWKVISNFNGTPTRTVTTTFAADSMGLLAKVVEQLDGYPNHDRWTEYAYNAAGDLTQTTVREANATTEDKRTLTVNCWGTANMALPGDRRTCPAGTGLHLVRTISRFVSGAPIDADTNVATDYLNDAYGQRTRGVRADGVATGWTYDNLGNQTAEIRNYFDGSVTVTNEQLGDSDIDPLASTQARTDLTTTFGYDTAGNRISTADPRQAIEAAKGTTLGPDDYVSWATFDALGQQLSERTPATPGVSITQKTATTRYDELGNVREATDFGGLVSGTEFDRAGRAVRTLEDTASGNPDVTSDATLDAAGRVTSAKDRRQADDPALGATVTAYDELGRATSVTEAWTNPITPLASITTTSYDALDQVLLEETGVGDTYITGQRTTYTYDLGGRVLSTDDEFACATKAYDWRDLATRETSGLQGGTCANGGDTREVTHSYDALGRLTSSEVTAGTGDGDILEAATYDAAGRRLSSSATASGVTTASTFDLNPLDEVRTEARSAGGATTTWSKTTYDPAGNPTDRCTWNIDPGSAACLPVGQGINPAPAVRSTTSYDARNNRLNLADGATSTTTTYDPDHNYLPRAFYVPTGTGRELQTLYEYDSRHRLDDPATTQVPGILHQLCILDGATPDPHDCSSTTTLGSDAYLHDDNDNRTQVVEANGSASSDRRYCYDGLNRLRARNTSPGTCTLTTGDELYTYDDAGNRLTAPGATATYDPEGQLATCTGCGTISHDSAGRITALAGWTYAYDVEGRLLVATEAASGDRLEMSYDAEGHRTQLREVTAGVLTRTRDLRYQGDAIVEEKVTDASHPTPGTIVRTYTVTEAGQVVSMTIPAGETGAGTYLPTWNGHGDALALWRQNADGTLTLANSYIYGTWGSPTTATHSGISDLGFRFLYVGAADVQWDDFSGAGLLYMHARHYSPLTGRFLQPDPSAAEANLYGYAGGSPVSLVDPSGESAWCAALLAFAAVGGSGLAGTAICIGLTGLIALALVSPVQAISRAVAKTVENEIRRGQRPSKKCVVIGEGMERVIARAQAYGCSWYKGNRQAKKIWNKEARYWAYMRHNERWILGQMGQGKVIIDIGPDFVARRAGRREALSPYYHMEHLTVRFYPGRVLLWDDPNAGLYSYLPRT